MSWMVVNMPWRITRSAEAAKLGEEFIAAVNAAQARWKTENPELAGLDASGKDSTDDAIAVQDDYPWVRGALGAPDLKAWRDDAISKCLEVPLHLQPSLMALVLHRYAYVLGSKYVDEDADVIRTNNACKARRDLEQSMEFIHHKDCEAGVQIEVVSDGQTKLLLIGDITASGMDGGCCADGIRDEDIIIRYRDLRPLIKDLNA